jgi:hypothetical protein
VGKWLGGCEGTSCGEKEGWGKENVKRNVKAAAVAARDKRRYRSKLRARQGV